MSKSTTSSESYNDILIAVVIPCYHVKGKILQLLEAIPEFVDHVICVDDACDKGSGHFITEQCSDPRVKVVFHRENQGVGGAMVTGFQTALELNVEIVIKIDGDGQMDPALMPYFINPIVSGTADYTKGNRFYRPESLAQMPRKRLFGNAVLSIMNKTSSGYWSTFDPTNGYLAIHANILRLLPLHKVSKRFFFESDMLFRLNTLRAVVIDVPMDALYDDEESSLSISSVLIPFLRGHLRNTIKRILYRYFLHDFNIASVELVLGLAMFLFGFSFGFQQWLVSINSGITASAGTVMVSALPIIVGMQLLLSFLNYDIASVPSHPVHNLIGDISFKASKRLTIDVEPAEM